MDFRSLEIMVSRSENLPMLPQVASSVIRIADDPDANVREIERLIERDSAIAGKVLRVANSSFYGCKSVTSIGRALNVLGLNAIRSLVVGIAYQQIISARQQSKLFSKVEFWRHSVATATIAKVIGRIRGLPAEELYTAGLLHDVGLLVLDRFAPDELDEAISHAREEKCSLVEMERRLFGYDHAAVGGLLAERWQLTPPLISAIRDHHRLEHSCEEEPNLVKPVMLADLIAHDIGYTNNVDVAPEASLVELADSLGIAEPQLEPIKAAVVAEVVRAEEALQIK